MSKNRRKRPKFEKFPVKFPVSRESLAETGSPLTVSSARESASNRCVFVVFSLAGIVLKLPRVRLPGEGIGGNQRRQMSGCGARTAAGSLEAVFESSDVERFGRLAAWPHRLRPGAGFVHHLRRSQAPDTGNDRAHSNPISF